MESPVRRECRRLVALAAGLVLDREEPGPVDLDAEAAYRKAKALRHQPDKSTTWPRVDDLTTTMHGVYLDDGYWVGWQIDDQNPRVALYAEDEPLLFRQGQCWEDLIL